MSIRGNRIELIQEQTLKGKGRMTSFKWMSVTGTRTELMKTDSSCPLSNQHQIVSCLINIKFVTDGTNTRT